MLKKEPKQQINRVKVMVCTYLEPEQVEGLERLAKREGTPKAVLIRAAIDAYLKREARR